MKEPSTETELQDALQELEVTLTETGDGYIARRGQSSVLLEAKDYVSALFEAWSLCQS